MKQAVAVAIVSISSLSPLLAGDARAITQTSQAVRPAAPPAAEWSATLSETLELSSSGKDEASLEIFERYVAQYPDFGQAHVMLCGVHEALSRQPRRRAGRNQHLEQAAAHCERAFSLWQGDGRGDWVRSLIGLYDPPPLGLGRPDRQRALAQEARDRFPAAPIGHLEWIRALALEDRGPDMDQAVRAARAAVARDAARRVQLAEGLWTIADQERIETGMAARLADASIEVMEEVAARSPKDVTVLRAQSRLWRSQAALSPPDRAKRLNDEADRVDKAITQLQAGAGGAASRIGTPVGVWRLARTIPSSSSNRARMFRGAATGPSSGRLSVRG